MNPRAGTQWVCVESGPDGALYVQAGDRVTVKSVDGDGVVLYRVGNEKPWYCSADTWLAAFQPVAEETAPGSTVPDELDGVGS